MNPNIGVREIERMVQDGTRYTVYQVARWPKRACFMVSFLIIAKLCQKALDF